MNNDISYSQWENGWIYFKNPVCTPLWSTPIKVVRWVAEFYHARNIRMGDTKWQHLLQTETGWASLLELKLTVSLRNLEFSEGKVSTDKLPRWDWIMGMSVRKAWFWTDIGGPSLGRWSWGKLEEYILVCSQPARSILHCSMFLGNGCGVESLPPSSWLECFSTHGLKPRIVRKIKPFSP